MLPTQDWVERVFIRGWSGPNFKLGNWNALCPRARCQPEGPPQGNRSFSQIASRISCRVRPDIWQQVLSRLFVGLCKKPRRTSTKVFCLLKAGPQHITSFLFFRLSRFKRLCAKMFLLQTDCQMWCFAELILHILVWHPFRSVIFFRFIAISNFLSIEAAAVLATLLRCRVGSQLNLQDERSRSACRELTGNTQKLVAWNV